MIAFRSNQIATQATSAAKRNDGLWTDYFFKLFTHMKKEDNFSWDSVERILKWMLCHYKKYSILTFILPVCFFDDIFDFLYLRIYHCVKIFSLYKLWPHFLFVFLKVTLIRTKSTYVQGLAKNYKTFSMALMSWWKMQNWWRSVDCTCKSAEVSPIFNPTLTSRTWIFSAHYSWVNFIYWLKLLSS